LRSARALPDIHDRPAEICAGHSPADCRLGRLLCSFRPDNGGARGVRARRHRAGIAVAWYTAPGRRFIVFANESVVEAKKVAWPSRKETLQTTAMVFGFVVAMSIFLWLTDKSFEWVLYDLVLGWKKS
jgi:preprotein translocase SecE subunit